jgi:hypothetical protein
MSDGTEQQAANLRRRRPAGDHRQPGRLRAGLGGVVDDLYVGSGFYKNQVLAQV